MDPPNKESENLEDIDRISDLPDAILAQILSLVPTKESVRTSVLSTRWKPIYGYVPVLNFCYNRNHPRPDTAYINFVTKVLNTVTQNLGCISKLSIGNSFYRPCIKNSDVTSWVETAVSNHVEEISIRISELVQKGARMNFPGLFTSGTLVSLSLDLGLRLSVPNMVFLPKLKAIWMKNVYLNDKSDNESVRRFFSGCPVLERLTMLFWNLGDAKVFEVSVPSLKRLSVLFFERAESMLLINCPKLEVLNYDSRGLGGYSGDVFEYLNKCNMEFDLSHDQIREGKVTDLVNQVCKTRSLTLKGDAMEALLYSPRPLSTFENMTHLELESFNGEGLRFLPELLTSSPRLESLVFPLGFFPFHVEDYEGVPFWQPGNVPTCLSHHLKSIRINNFLGEEAEYTLVEFFLTNAFVLEKMEICLWSCDDSDDEGKTELEAGGEGEEKMEVEEKAECEGEAHGVDEHKFNKNLERHFEISKRLLTFQRFSEVCRIVFLEPEEW